MSLVAKTVTTQEIWEVTVPDTTVGSFLQAADALREAAVPSSAEVSLWSMGGGYASAWADRRKTVRATLGPVVNTEGPS